MEPGDLVLYESHSVIHGRPFPFEGDHYANIFVHFEPTGHSARHEAKIAAKKAASGIKGADAEYRSNKAASVTGHEGSNHTGDDDDEEEGEDKGKRERKRERQRETERDRVRKKERERAPERERMRTARICDFLVQFFSVSWLPTMR